MQNPVEVNLTTKNTWYLVAEDVSYGTIDIVEHPPSRYKYTYRLTGESAPTTLEAAILCQDDQLSINATDPIDVYMICILDKGKVVVSL